MSAQNVITHTYQVTLTAKNRDAFRFGSKKAAKAFIAAIKSENLDIKLIPRQRSNSYDSTNNYAVSVNGLYVQHYKIIIDQFSLQPPDDAV